MTTDVELMILEQLREMREEMRRMRDAMNRSMMEISNLKAKMALIAAITATLVTALSQWAVKVFF